MVYFPIRKNCRTENTEYFGVNLFWWNHQMRFKMIHANTKNAKSKGRQSQVCYLEHIPLPLNIFYSSFTLIKK